MGGREGEREGGREVNSVVKVEKGRTKRCIIFMTTEHLSRLCSLEAELSRLAGRWHILEVDNWESKNWESQQQGSTW